MTPKKFSDKIGMEPGSLVHIGERKQDTTAITVIEYNEDELKEYALTKAGDLEAVRDNPLISWINIDGIHDAELLRETGDLFNLHSLLLEDVLNTQTRPKLEEYSDHIFFTLKMLQPDGEEIYSEQVSFVLGENYVISFQEQSGDVFEPIRERIRHKKGRVRAKQSDYLLYLLLDVIIDNYFIIIEEMEESIASLEAEILENPEKHHPSDILHQKRAISALKKVITPLKEDINKLTRAESPRLNKKNKHYFADLNDHVLHILETLESNRETLSGLMDIYVTAINNKMSEVMKVLTIIATLFIPLTFIAGVYGMNFEYMPELSWKWGYFGILGFMAASIVLMLIYFRRQKWF